MAYRLSRALCKLLASKAGRTRQVDRGSASAEMYLKANETAIQRRCFGRDGLKSSRDMRTEAVFFQGFVWDETSRSSG